MEERSNSYDFGEVPNSVIVKMTGDHVIFNYLKPFDENPDDYCHLRIERSKEYDIEYNPDDDKTRYYFIDIYIDGKRFYESKESKFGSYLSSFPVVRYIYLFESTCRLRV